MDLLNEDQVREKIVIPFVSKVNAETIPALKAAVVDVVHEAVNRLQSDVLKTATEQLSALLGQTANEVQLAARMLDGATLTIEPVQVELTISKCTVRLTIPRLPA